jgi:hypothetical protein
MRWIDLNWFTSPFIQHKRLEILNEELGIRSSNGPQYLGIRLTNTAFTLHQGALRRGIYNGPRYGAELIYNIKVAVILGC